MNFAITSFMPKHTVIRIKKNESRVPQVCITGHHSVQEIVRYFVNRCLQFQKSANNTQNLIEFFFGGGKLYPSYCLIEDCRKLFVDAVQEVRRMFPHVEKILRLLLLSPASSCQAESSFSSLRLIKTWLRNTMTQKRSVV